jgi:16S rRNA G966 N2-methylase RsmD
MEDRCQVYGKDAFTLLRTLKQIAHSPPSFSFVFLDPPYRFGRYKKLLEKLLSAEVMVLGQTLVILEVFRKEELNFLPGELSLIQTVDAGDSRLLLLR